MIEYINVILPGSSEPQSIKIRNMQIAGDINMEGWKLRDQEGHVYTFPHVVVREGFYVEVISCHGEDVIENKYAILYTGICEPLMDGDGVQLVDINGTVVDSYP